MANHGFVTSKEPISLLDVENLIKDLNDKDFKNYLDVDLSDEMISVSLKKEFKEDGIILIWLNSKKQLEFRPQSCHNTRGFSYYVYVRLLDTIAFNCNGLISDESSDETWKASFKYNTFKKWTSNESSMFDGKKKTISIFLWKQLLTLLAKAQLKRVDPRLRNL